MAELEALLPLASVPADSFSEWTSGDRTSAAVQELEVLADGVSAAQLNKLRDLCRSSSWSELLAGSDGGSTRQISALLALLLALLSRSDTAAPAASALLAAMNCPGSTSHGVFHPLVLFELTKAPRPLLFEEAESPARGRAAPKGAARAAAAAVSPAPSHGELLESIRHLLTCVPLRAHSEAHEQLIELLASVGAYAELGLCLGDAHGDADHTLPTVMRALLPTLTLEGGVGAAALAAQRECVRFVAVALEGQLIPGASDDGGRRAGAALQAVQALLQRASVAAPERAEPRDKVCAALARLLARVPAVVGSGYANFLWRYSRTAKPSARLFACEMASALLREAATSDTPSPGASTLATSGQPTPLHAAGTPQTLWRLLVARLDDKVAAVRAKAVGVSAVAIRAMADEAPPRALLSLVQAPLPEASAAPPASEQGTPASALVPTPVGGGAASAVDAAAASAVANGTTGTPASTSSHVRSLGAAGGPADSSRRGARDSVGSVASAAATPRPPALATPSAELLAAAAPVDASLGALGAQLLARCVDPKPAVRRAALSGVLAWVRAGGVSLSAAQLAVVSRRAQDTSPAIRKQAARTLHDLLLDEGDAARATPAGAGTSPLSALPSAWAASVLPQVRDAETSVSEAAVDMLREALLLPLEAAAPAASTGRRAENRADAPRRLRRTWALLGALTPETEAMLSRGVARLAQQGRLPAALGAAVLALLDPEAAGDIGAPTADARTADSPTADAPTARAARSAMWGVVGELAKLGGGGQAAKAGTACALDGALLARRYEALAERGTEAAAEAALALSALTAMAQRGRLEASVATSVARRVEQDVRLLTAPAELMAPLVQACTAMLPETAEWSADVLSECHQALRRSGVATQHASKDGHAHAHAVAAAAADVRTRTALVVVGELVMASPALLTPQLLATIEAFATAQAVAEAEVETAVGTAETVADLSSSEAAASVGALAVTAFVTLGKCCHGSSTLSERLLPIFVRELTASSSAAVRNNALVVLADLARVHTALVDRHVSALALALGDVCAFVRQQALLLVSQLLLEGFVKPRPVRRARGLLPPPAGPWARRRLLHSPVCCSSVRGLIVVLVRPRVSSCAAPGSRCCVRC